MKIRLLYTRNNDLKFISHLNTVDLLQRSVFYTNERVMFSEGFNPHPKMGFGNPLPLGVSSDYEIFDVDIEGEVDLEKFVDKLNEYLPKDIQIFRAYDASSDESISKIYKYSIYEFTVTTKYKLDEIDLIVDDELIIERKKKSKNKEKIYVSEDISSYVEILDGFNKSGENEYKLIAKLENSFNKIINPLNFIVGVFNKYGLAISIYDVSIHKKEMI